MHAISTGAAHPCRHGALEKEHLPGDAAAHQRLSSPPPPRPHTPHPHPAPRTAHPLFAHLAVGAVVAALEVGVEAFQEALLGEEAAGNTHIVAAAGVQGVLSRGISRDISRGLGGALGTAV